VRVIIECESSREGRVISGRIIGRLQRNILSDGCYTASRREENTTRDRGALMPGKPHGVPASPLVLLRASASIYFRILQAPPTITLTAPPSRHGPPFAWFGLSGSRSLLLSVCLHCSVLAAVCFSRSDCIVLSRRRSSSLGLFLSFRFR
jgi:hypothetical protein